MIKKHFTLFTFDVSVWCTGRSIGRHRSECSWSHGKSICRAGNGRCLLTGGMMIFCVMAEDLLDFKTVVDKFCLFWTILELIWNDEMKKPFTKWSDIPMIMIKVFNYRDTYKAKFWKAKTLMNELQQRTHNKHELGYTTHINVF